MAGTRPAQQWGAGLRVLTPEHEEQRPHQHAQELWCEPRANFWAVHGGPCSLSRKKTQSSHEAHHSHSGHTQATCPQPSPLSARGTHPTSSSPWHRSFLSKATISLQQHVSLATVSGLGAWRGDLLQAGRTETLAPGDGATRCEAGPWWPSAMLNSVPEATGQTDQDPSHPTPCCCHSNPSQQPSRPVVCPNNALSGLNLFELSYYSKST